MLLAPAHLPINTSGLRSLRIKLIILLCVSILLNLYCGHFHGGTERGRTRWRRGAAEEESSDDDGVNLLIS